MKLHELRSIRTQKKHARVGRGGKRGTTSGRGQKGQRSRSGHRIRPASRDLILKLPKKRGFMNKPTSPKPRIVRMDVLMKKITPLVGGGKEIMVDMMTLKQVGLVPPEFRGKVKILGTGTAAHQIVIKEILVSKSVKAAVEKAGGVIANNANESKISRIAKNK